MQKKRLLRISTVSHSLNLLLKGQLRYMNRQGFDVFTASSYDENVEDIVNREGVQHFALPLTRTLNPISDLWALYKTILLIRRIRPDIVHTHSPKAGIVGMLAAWLCKVPVRLHTVAGLPLMETEGAKKKLLIWVEKIAYACSHYVLSNSMKLREYILNEIYDNKDKVVVLGKGSTNGIDLSYFNDQAVSDVVLSKTRNELNIEEGDYVLCFVGRLTYYKGVNELVKAFIKLKDKNTRQLKLLLVGPFEDLNPLEFDILKEIKNNDNIIAVGHQNDIRPYLLLSDIFVFPSYREGFPQSLMQAAAMGLACVATNINGCNEIIEDGQSGLLIHPKNTEAIVEKVQLLVDNDALRSTLAKNAFQNMVKNYEQQMFWNLIADFYKKCIHAKNNN